MYPHTRVFHSSWRRTWEPESCWSHPHWCFTSKRLYDLRWPPTHTSCFCACLHADKQLADWRAEENSREAESFLPRASLLWSSMPKWLSGSRSSPPPEEKEPVLQGEVEYIVWYWFDSVKPEAFCSLLLPGNEPCPYSDVLLMYGWGTWDSYDCSVDSLWARQKMAGPCFGLGKKMIKRDAWQV